jgi:SAM-dependent methyltransferase
MIPIEHRKNGYALLSGDGLEIGALHEPAELPIGARARYLDAISETQAAAIFREIPSEKLVKVDIVGDLDGGVLAQFRDGSFDFVVMNHVIEHIANPVKAIRETFRVCRGGGGSSSSPYRTSTTHSTGAASSRLGSTSGRTMRAT